MAHTVRTKWTYQTGEPRIERGQPDHSCKPGCETCGKGTRRRENRKARREANRPTRFHLDD